MAVRRRHTGKWTCVGGIVDRRGGRRLHFVLGAAVAGAACAGAAWWAWQVHLGSFADQVGRANIAAFDLALLLALAGVFRVLVLLSRRSRASAGVVAGATPLDRATAYLAAAVAQHWDAQVKYPLRILAPQPIRVRWDYGPPGLVPHEALPVGGLMARRRGTVLDNAAADDVTGLFRTVYRPLTALGARPLVLLGEGGQGKTGAMALLIRDLLKERARSEDPAAPIPIWLPLGDWNPVTTPFREWIATELFRTYPALRSADLGGESAVHDLVAAGRLVFFLDGLDEMPRDLRADALNRLDREPAGSQFVISSRTTEYERALKRGRLDGAVPVELRPVELSDAVHYLLAGQAAGRLHAWRRLTDGMWHHPDGVAARIFSSPLALTLVRDAYHHGDPGELLDGDRFGTERDVMVHLMDRLVLIAYGSQRRAAPARRRLAAIAAHLGTRRSIYWWEVVRWVPEQPLQRLIRYTAAGCFALCGAGAVTVLASPGIGLATLVCAFVGARAGSPKRASIRDLNQQVDRLVPRVPAAPEVLATASQAFLVAAVAATVPSLVTDLPITGAAPLTPWLAAALAFAGWSWLRTVRSWTVPTQRDRGATPRSSYRNEWWLSCTRAATIAILIGLAVLITGAGPLLAVMIGLGAAAAHWVEYTSIASVWFADTYLRIRDRRTQSLTRLLDDALRRQLLRQVGVAYQFRHAALQEFLALEHAGRRAAK
jgi:hypothetical protein